MRIFTGYRHGAACSAGAASIISRTVPGQGMGISITRSAVDGSGFVMAIHHHSRSAFSLVFDTLLLPLDASHGPYNQSAFIPSHRRQSDPLRYPERFQLKFSLRPTHAAYSLPATPDAALSRHSHRQNALCRFAA